MRGQVPGDIDVRVATDSIERVGQQFREFLGDRCVGSHIESRIASLVVETAGGRVSIDLTAREGETVGEDAFSRDLTINAMAMDVREVAGGSARLLDPTGGAGDIHLTGGIIKDDVRSGVHRRSRQGAACDPVCPPAGISARRPAPSGRSGDTLRCSTRCRARG